jgi:lysophospholipase L1-like esterase
VPIVIFICLGLLLVVLWLSIRMGVFNRGDGIDGRVVFIGSSTIARFPLEKTYHGSAANLGKADENAVEMRARIARELPDDARPSAFILYAGSYDFRKEPGLSAQEIRDRVDGIAGDLRARFPETPIALIEVLPARSQTAEEHAALAALNSELATLARGRGASFIPTNRPPLGDANGDLLETMSVDRFHLNDAGYRVLAKWIREDGGPVGELLR